jgi:hypothetical protein
MLLGVAWIPRCSSRQPNRWKQDHRIGLETSLALVLGWMLSVGLGLDHLAARLLLPASSVELQALLRQQGLGSSTEAMC